MFHPNKELASMNVCSFSVIAAYSNDLFSGLSRKGRHELAVFWFLFSKPQLIKLKDSFV
jgi:hypothetical protein